MDSIFTLPLTKRERISKLPKLSIKVMVESGSRSEVASLPRPDATAGRAPARRAHRAHGAHGLREDHAVCGDVARPRAAGGE